RSPRGSPLFPYTTLFRSGVVSQGSRRRRAACCPRVGVTAWTTGQKRPARGGSRRPARGNRRPGRPSPQLELRRRPAVPVVGGLRSEEHTSELQSPYDLVC